MKPQPPTVSTTLIIALALTTAALRPPALLAGDTASLPGVSKIATHDGEVRGLPEIAGGPSSREVEEALALLRRYLRGLRVSERRGRVESGPWDLPLETRAGGEPDANGFSFPGNAKRSAPAFDQPASRALELHIPLAGPLPFRRVDIGDNSLAIYSDHIGRIEPALQVHSDEACAPSPQYPEHAAIFAATCSDGFHHSSQAVGVMGVVAGSISGPVKGYGLYGKATGSNLSFAHGVFGEARDYGVYGTTDWPWGHGGHFVNDDRLGASGATQVALYAETFLGSIIEGWEAVAAVPYRELRFKVSRTGDVSAEGTISGGGADFAESVLVTGTRSAYEPGDVLEISEGSTAGLHTFRKATAPYSKRVAGIFSTKPGFLGAPAGIDDPVDRPEIPMAIVGIVPCKVSAENGPISRGDLLVSATIPGYAMKGTDPERMQGATLGKALGELAAGTGRIDVLVTLR